MEHLHPALALALAPYAPPRDERKARSLAASVVEVLVEDVRYRARRHGFALTDGKSALELVRQSAHTLGLDPSTAQLEEAASRLT